MHDPFAGWMSEVSSDAITILPSDINGEARANLWSFSLTAEQAIAVTPSDVEAFLGEIINARRNWLTLHSVSTGAMRFYCWHDEQAAQLRLSLVSAKHGRIPFGCRVEEVQDLAVVARSFLHPKYHDGIPWDELKPVSTDLPDVVSEFTLFVWCVSLP